MGPQIAFGLSSALSGTRMTTTPTPTLPAILARLPHLVFWIWSNLLLEVISNQRQPSSIAEDSVNKPWRPLPTARLTPVEARRLLLWTTPVICLSSWYLGALPATAALLVFSNMYNDLDGANEDPVVRNILNACGLGCFNLGASIVATDSGTHTLNRDAYAWMFILGAVTVSTVHTQDLADVQGDRLRGRKTVPLVHGEEIARWSVAVMVAAWSVFCPIFWGLSVLGFLPSLGVGGYLSVTVIRHRSVRADKVSWRMWCAWMMTLYLLPLL